MCEDKNVGKLRAARHSEDKAREGSGTNAMGKNRKGKSKKKVISRLLASLIIFFYSLNIVTIWRWVETLKAC